MRVTALAEAYRRYDTFDVQSNGLLFVCSTLSVSLYLPWAPVVGSHAVVQQFREPAPESEEISARERIAASSDAEGRTIVGFLTMTMTLSGTSGLLSGSGTTINGRWAPGGPFPLASTGTGIGMRHP